MATPAIQSNNPFVGPRSIEVGEPIFGREPETRKLANQLLANRIVLMYSPSGAGKTSLIQAALIPRLVSRKFSVLPTIRVNLNPPEGFASIPGFNPYIFSALSSLEECQEASRRLPLEERAHTSFNDYLNRLDSSRPLLIFDQFEEILTTSPMDREGKNRFFEQLGEALDTPDRWALFAIREDYLGGLDPYMLPIPTRFKHTFRLNLLEKEAAREVVQSTAALGNVEFTGPAAARMIDDLTRVKAQLPDGTWETQAGLYVEPVHLQVVCQSLWEKRDPNDPDITEDEIVDIGDVDDSLAGYYNQKLSAISREAGVKERLIRIWFDQQLITKTGVRSPVIMEPGQTAGLENDAIQELVNAHLVRRDTRSGTTWFELAHDRLISPIRRSNAAWFEANLSVLQRQAARWQAENRPDHLLLRGEILKEAEAWAGVNPGEVSREDGLFLEACREARRKEEAAQRLADAMRRSQTQRRFLTVVSIALLVAVFLGIYSALQTVKVGSQAESLARQADSLSTLAEDNRQKSEENASIAATARWNAAAAQTAGADALVQKGVAETEKAAADVLRATAEFRKIEADRLAGLARQNAQVAFARQLTAQGHGLFDTQPDLAALLAAESYAITHTWESKSLLLDLVQQSEKQTIQEFGPPIPEQPASIQAIALSPDQQRLAWGTQQGFVAVWNYLTRRTTSNRAGIRACIKEMYSAWLSARMGNGWLPVEASRNYSSPM